MRHYYSAERHTEILIALIKFHNVRKIIASPGATDCCFVGSVQHDKWFEMYSSVDERSAAYMACGMAAESGEPVAIVCTGATASRDYMPGLTEAFYRQLPVLAITTTQHRGRIGNGCSQVVDRSVCPKDVARRSINVDAVHTPEDEWACSVAINKALIDLRRNGGGPVHINLTTTYSPDFSIETLPEVTGILYTDNTDNMPSLEKYKRIAILVGAHGKWSDKLSHSVEAFCNIYNAVVLMNHASNYKGKYGVNHAIIINMKDYTSPNLNADLVIYIGSISRYPSGMNKRGCKMWRVNPDGEIRDFEKKTTRVFAMTEEKFFAYYVDGKKTKTNNGKSFAASLQQEYDDIIGKADEAPLSNVWVARHTISSLPDGCVFHLAGSNTARAWNFFKLPKGVECYSNDGVMGIDGQVSSLIGESLVAPERLHFGVVGDLTFFYDMNSIGNRHVGNNLRLMVINNGKGAEFKIYSHACYQFGDDAEPYMAAAGHFGNKSHVLLMHYAQDLGFEYLCANTKEEFLKAITRFLTPSQTDKPILFEVFTDSADESDAIYLMNHIVQDKFTMKRKVKAILKRVLPNGVIAMLKKIKQ